MPVYFSSQKQPKRSVGCTGIFLFSLTNCQSLYCFCVILNCYNCCSTQTFCWLCLHIFVLTSIFPELIYCFCVALNCYNSCACIVVIGKKPKGLLVMPVYFVLANTLPGPTYCFCVIINCYNSCSCTHFFSFLHIPRTFIISV